MSLPTSLVDGNMEAQIGLECKTDFLKVGLCRNTLLFGFAGGADGAPPGP
jgi:hypothetical protein